MALVIRGSSPDTAPPRQLVTPEGVPIDLILATLPDRITAFLIDGMIITASLIATIVAMALFGLAGSNRGLWALFDLVIFALLNGYFIWFEVRWAGRTPGKRAAGIRVLSRSGGPLRADAIIARNLMRSVEVFVPLAVVVFHKQAFPDLPVLAWVMACVWILALALLPAFNRDRLRAGDLVGGTWVVRAPRASLLRDLARRATAGPAQKAGAVPETAAAHAFTAAQLDVYGIFELQALEDVLRSHNPDAPKMRTAVAAKIVKKIGYAAPLRLDAARFLADFYAALRAHHERRLLFGQRKEKKTR